MTDTFATPIQASEPVPRRGLSVTVAVAIIAVIAVVALSVVAIVAVTRNDTGHHPMMGDGTANSMTGESHMMGGSMMTNDGQ